MRMLCCSPRCRRVSQNGAPLPEALPGLLLHSRPEPPGDPGPRRSRAPCVSGDLRSPEKHLAPRAGRAPRTLPGSRATRESPARGVSRRAAGVPLAAEPRDSSGHKARLVAQPGAEPVLREAAAAASRQKLRSRAPAPASPPCTLWRPPRVRACRARCARSRRSRRFSSWLDPSSRCGRSSPRTRLRPGRSPGTCSRILRRTRIDASPICSLLPDFQNASRVSAMRTGMHCLSSTRVLSFARWTSGPACPMDL